MSRSDSKHRLPKKTTSESIVERSLSETDKLVADVHEKNFDDDLNLRHHSYPQTEELKINSQADHKKLRDAVIQEIIAIHHQIDILKNNIQKLEELVSTLETEKINTEKFGNLNKSNHVHQRFQRKESQKSNKETKLRNMNKITHKSFPLPIDHDPLSIHQDPLYIQSLDKHFIPDLSKCGKRRIHSQTGDKSEVKSEGESDDESEEEPEEHSNIYLKYKIREFNLAFMSESSLALNKEWPVQLFHPLWPQKNFTKCDCKQFRK